MKSDREQAFYDEMWRFWTPLGAEVPPCIRCWKEAVTLHEIKPRSLYPEWMEDSFNSVPVCHTCHEWAEADIRASGIKISALRNERLHQIASWKKTRNVRNV